MNIQQQSSMSSQFENVIKHGTYYYPAERHYYSGCVVRCDRCDRTNLKASIGYHEIDLCLACASQIESLLPRVNPPSIIPGSNPPSMPFINPSGPTMPFINPSTIVSPPRNYIPSHGSNPHNPLNPPTHFFSSNNSNNRRSNEGSILGQFMSNDRDNGIDIAPEDRSF